MLEKVVKETGVKVVYVATDKNPMIDEIEKSLKNYQVSCIIGYIIKILFSSALSCSNAQYWVQMCSNKIMKEISLITGT